MSRLKKHAPGRRRDGRRPCGAKIEAGLTALTIDDLTCQRCIAIATSYFTVAHGGCFFTGPVDAS